ncbi:MAG: MFS transporter, partial [Parabacteroides sp.]|nr:MFS transporter [Parabacteroides sp.]
MGTRRNSKLFILIFLGMLTAFGPFVTDMYLPTLPAMSQFFNTSSSFIQLGLTTSMIGLAVGQLLFGPLSDKYGRRFPLISALSLFLISTIGCIYSPNIIQFVGWRLIQGIAGAGGIVISRSIAADKYSGKELAK